MPSSRPPRPGRDQRLEQSRQRYGEENPPEPPDTTKEKHRHNDRYRMNIVGFREQDGSQHIAIQRLKHTIGNHHIEKLAAHTKMKTRYRRDWQRPYRCPDVRHQYRKPYRDSEQCRIGQPEKSKSHKSDNAHDHNLDTLATHIIGNLVIHFIPDSTHQQTLPR